MVLRLGYSNRIVEISEDTIYVFNGRLFSAPLEEVIRYYTTGEVLLPPAIKEVAGSVAKVLLRTGDFNWKPVEGTSARWGLVDNY